MQVAQLMRVSAGSVLPYPVQPMRPIQQEISASAYLALVQVALIGPATAYHFATASSTSKLVLETAYTIASGGALKGLFTFSSLHI